jgi:hypothetical protein
VGVRPPNWGPGGPALGPGGWGQPEPHFIGDPFSLGGNDMDPFRGNPYGMIGGPFGNERGGE